MNTVVVDQDPAPAASRWIAEALTLGLLAVHALVPGIFQPLIRLYGLAIPAADVAMCVLGPLLLLVAIGGLRFPARLWLLLALPMGACTLLALLSLATWAPAADAEDAVVRGLPYLATFGAFTTALALVAGRPMTRVPGLLDRLTVLIAVIATAYAIKSLFAAGLSLSFINDSELRARGPLWSPAVGHVAVLPALGWSVGRALDGAGRTRWRWVAVALVLLFAAFALGSRGAIAGLGVLITLLALRLRGLGRRLWTVGIAMAASAALFAGVMALADHQRLFNLGDPNRGKTYETVVRVASQDPDQLLLGRGAGAVWPWYRLESTTRERPNGVDGAAGYVVGTPAGDSLYHPHSLIFLLLLEVGLAGVLLLGSIGAALLWALLGRGGGAAADAAACALAASCTSLILDTVLFKSWPLSSMWWVFLLGVLALRMDRQAESGP